MSLIIKDNDNHLIKKPISAESTDNNISQNISNTSNVVTIPTVSHPSQLKYGSTITLIGSGSLTAFKDNGAIIDTYEWVLPDGSIIESNTISYIMPDSNHIGETVTIKCRARDTLNNYSRYQIISITTSDNHPPIIDDISWNDNDHYENNSYTLTITAHDPDIEDTISYIVTCNDTNVTVTQDATNPNIFHIDYPNYIDDITTVTYTIAVTDNDGASTISTIIQQVHNINHDPIIDNASWNNTNQYENHSYTLTITAHDPDIEDSITYEVTCGDNNVSIVQNNNHPNIFTVTYPSYNSNVTLYFTIKVTDNHGAFTILTLSQLVRNQPGNRGIFGSGDYSTSSHAYYSSRIDYITIPTPSNAHNFGNVVQARHYLTGTSNSTNNRGIFAGGSYYYHNNTTFYTIIEYVTIPTPSNAHHYKNLSTQRSGLAATSNGTNDRAIFAGGWNMSSMEYSTITTSGNAHNFGHLTIARQGLAAISNNTNERGVFAGGNHGDLRSSGTYSRIDYITISTLSNATSFGNLTISRTTLAGTSNGTNDRGVFAGGSYNGWDDSSPYNRIDYITIPTPSNAHNFGHLTISRYGLAGSSNTTNERGVFGGGDYSTIDHHTSRIDYITINTPSNAHNFGNLTHVRNALAATSNG